MARVSVQHREHYRVIGENGEMQAVISGKLGYQAEDAPDYPAVGDWVLVDRQDDAGGNAIIRHILPRRTVFRRKAAGAGVHGQIVAANIDHLFICMALNQDFSLRRLERYLAIAWDSGAIPVVVLITFLIGIVMAYLLGLQAAQYGASVFVIDGVALGMVREFSPLLVAIIIAGRSGAAFTAELGTMRMTQETDAIAMLGLSQGQVLIVPRVLALIITMPLLVFIGDLSGLVGAAMVCRWMLDLSFQTFVERIHTFLGVQHAVIGIGKAPFFAVAIATIACRLGMTAARDTRAIGIATTSTVVQAIVTVIVIDAAFAVTFQIGDL